MRTLFTGLTPPDTDCIHTPLIEIVPVKDDSALRRAFAHVQDYDYLLFTSRFAVKHFLGAQSAISHPAMPLRSAKDLHPSVISIGKTTTAALHETGIKEVIQMEHDNSYGVIDWFSKQPHGKVLIPRSDIALPIIPDGLRVLGFEVDTVTAYVNRMPLNPMRVDLKEIDRIVFTSPSTIDHFIRLYGALPKDKIFVTRGPVTQAYLDTLRV